MNKNLLILISILTLNSCNMNNNSDLSDGLYADIETSKGNIVLQLYYEQVPTTVSNFVALAEGNHPIVDEQHSGKPYYNGLKFHRVIENFMIQGGDPTGTGSGGPGYQFDDEFSSDLTHDGPGILSMANSGPGTNGSQFFITHVETPWLDGKHTIFGKVSSGLNILDNVEQEDIIKNINIVRVGEDANNFDAPNIFESYINNKSEVDVEKAGAEQEAIKDITKGMSETESGIKYKISKKGTGDNAKTNDLLSVHYSLQLIDGSEIDSSFTRGAPIEFTCGVGEVIKGWDEAMQLLNKGSKARLVIPSELGYGSMGAGNGAIPPNATLIFDVELVDIK